MKGSVYDDRVSTLGEGAFWHPVRQQFFWFDILGSKLHTRDAHGRKSWDLGEYGSAAGWIDKDRLLMATETGIWRFDLLSGARERLVAMEADDASTRSNDGRVDPWGGFWASTIGKRLEKGAGSIYRFYKGELRRLYAGITIPNDICFTHDRAYAYFADTAENRVMRVALAAGDGWPAGEPELFLDFSGEGTPPDGAVVDADGLLWIAQWGASRVAAYAPDGKFVKAVSVSAPQVTCPAFGGADFTTLYITTARENMDIWAVAKFPESGMVFRAFGAGRGMPEYKAVL